MESVKHRFRNLDTIVEDVRKAIDDSTRSWIGSLVEPDVVEVAKFVTHEWIANLVRHAAFPASERIDLDIWTEGNKIHIVIEDNSDGFDLEAELDQARRELGSKPERGMGLVLVCRLTSGLDYAHLSPNHHRVAWTVEADDDAHLDLS